MFEFTVYFWIWEDRSSSMLKYLEFMVQVANWFWLVAAEGSVASVVH